MKVTNPEYREKYPNLTICHEKEVERLQLEVFLIWLNDENIFPHDEPARLRLMGKYLGYDHEKAVAEGETIMNNLIASMHKPDVSTGK